jgi:hypothetical protein
MYEPLKAGLDKTIMIICGIIKNTIIMYNKKHIGFGGTIWID